MQGYQIQGKGGGGGAVTLQHRLEGSHLSKQLVQLINYNFPLVQGHQLPA